MTRILSLNSLFSLYILGLATENQKSKIQNQVVARNVHIPRAASLLILTRPSASISLSVVYCLALQNLPSVPTVCPSDL